MTNTPPLQHSDEVWLLNSGYVTEHAEQNLVLYGYISAPGVMEVELLINPENRVIKYLIVLSDRVMRRYKLQLWLESKRGLLGKLALLLFLRAFGSYDPAARVVKCVKDYAGPAWTTTAEVTSVKQYLEVVSQSRGKGWFFKDGTDEGPGVPGQNRSPAPSPSDRR